MKPSSTGQALKAVARRPASKTVQIQALLEFPFPRAVTAGTVTRGRKVRTAFHCALASPGSRSLQWWCFCCHRMQSDTKGGLTGSYAAQLTAPSTNVQCGGPHSPESHNRALRSQRHSLCRYRGHHHKTHWQLQAWGKDNHRQ